MRFGQRAPGVQKGMKKECVSKNEDGEEVKDKEM